MKTLDLAPARDSARPSRAGTPPPALLAQRHSTFGGGSIAAPPLVGQGRSLEPATRQEMEQGFGRDFGAIRVHDDARAHDSARALGAIAYAAGDNIVFGAGHYAPETPAGRSLLAHELAHTVQQSGVQMKADGPLPAAADARLEAEADSAARAVTAGRPAPSLSRISAPAVFRATGPVSTGGSAIKKSQPGPNFTLTEGGAGTIEQEDAPGVGATFASVTMKKLVIPKKGSGSWAKEAYQLAAQKNALIYDAKAEAGTFKAIIEPQPNYKTVWLNQYGFTTLADAGTKIKASASAPTDPVAIEILDAMIANKATFFDAKGDRAGGCDIDHIVEKQLKGDNNPTNLQLLSATSNRSAGSTLRGRLAGLACEIRDQVRPGLTSVRVKFADVEVGEGAENDKYLEASCAIEGLLRSKSVVGSADVQAKVQQYPVSLRYLAAQTVTGVRPSGSTAIEGPAATLIKGIKLVNYRRAKVGAKVAETDTVTAELDDLKIVPGKNPIVFKAMPDAAPAAVPGADPAATAPTAPATTAAPASERRELTLTKGKLPPIDFDVIGASPAVLTSYEVGDGGLTGKGKLTPTLKFLPAIDVVYGPNLLKLEVPLDAKKLKPIGSLIAFTGGALKLGIIPELKPEGNITFAIGPASNPLMLGDITATAEGGAFVATGTLVPGRALPGISDAKGSVVYHSTKGWSGSLTAKSVGKIPASTVEAELSFKEEGGKFVYSATGGITTQIKDKVLKLNLAWTELDGIVYSGGFTWPKPFPIIDSVDISGTYKAGSLSLTGKSAFTFRQWTGSLTVHYLQKDGEAGKLWGTGSVDVETKNKKGKGSLTVNVDANGALTGEGKISYQVTEKIKPILGVKLSAGGHLRISGAVEIGTIDLFPKWPEGDKGKRTLMSASPSFKIPTPIPAVNAAVNVRAAVGVSFSVGPGQIREVLLEGAFDPLEENPNVTAMLKGKFVIPTSFSLYGEFGAELGVEIAGGAVGISGGINVEPSLTLGADAIVAVEASYAKGEFAFSGKAYLDAKLSARLGINLTATFYAGWGLYEYRWKYPVAAITRQLGPNLRINLGQISYSTLSGVTWPSLSDISIEPKDIDPLAVVQQLLSEKNETEAQK
jgi:hypothetical protein